MKRLFLLFTATYILSCNAENSSDGEAAIQSDTSISTKAPVHSSAQNALYINKEQLLGLWTDGNSENATFDIQQDSIYYTDEGVGYPFYLRDDSLTIQYPDMSFKGKVSLIGDTLILADPEFGMSKFVRFKN